MTKLQTFQHAHTEAAFDSEFLLSIDGELVEVAETFDVLNPANNEVLAQAPLGSKEHMEAAISAAKRAFKVWSSLTWEDRSRYLLDYADALEKNKEELITLLTLEQGKPRHSMATEEVDGAIHWVRETAKRRLPVQQIEDTDVHTVEVHRTPLGVVGAITPWNFPVFLGLWKVAPALITGNTMVMKPSPYTPLCTLRFGEIAQRVLPPGVFNVVSGGNELGQQLTEHRGVAKISFTGSVPIGRQIVEMSAKTLKKVTMELGGHAPVIVHRDADIAAFAQLASLGKFRNAGQVCASPTRFYVHESIFDKTVAALVERSKALRLGDPLEQNTDLGPLTTSKRRDTIERLVDEASSDGAQILCGGRRPEKFSRGWFYEPTLVANPAPHLGLMNDEPFGPVGTLTPFSTMDEVIGEANRLPFALAAYVFTRSMRNTLETTERLQAGVIGVNTFVASTAESPFGGSKDSGFGREGGPNVIRDYMDTKFINLELAQDESPADAAA